MTKLAAKIYTRLHSEKGATAVEYGLMVALIGAFIIGAVTLLGGSLDALFTAVTDAIEAATP